MSVSVRRLCRNVSKDYRIRFVAGSEGLDNKVNWVHMIEDYDVADFLHGNEMILTTGIGNLNSVDYLIKFVEKLHEINASGIMINIGPYIHSIPKEVMDLCNEKKIPLFQVPWDVRLVDLTRQFCRMLIESEEKEKSLTSLVKDFLFKPNDREKLYSDLTRHGFLQHLNYCVITVGIAGSDETMIDNKGMEFLHGSIEREIYRITNNYVIFKNDINYIVITAGVNTKSVHSFVVNLSSKNIFKNLKIYIGVSTNKDNLRALPKNYELSEKVYKLSRNIGETPLFYDQLEIYNFLLSVSDTKTMKDYEKNILGPLIEYDEGNGTDYFDFVKIYMEKGASIQQVANSMYVHRNTINYKINKIKEIAGLNLSDLDDLLKIKLCLKIRNIK